MASSIILIIFILFLIIFKNKLLAILLFLPLLFYFITYDIRFSSEVNDLLIFQKISNYNNYFFFGIAILLSVIIVLIIDNEYSIKFRHKKKSIIIYNSSKLLICFYVTSILALFGTFINLLHVNFSFNLLFESPREYEMTFGSSTFINYLYFLSPIAICIFLYLKHNKIRVKFATIILTFLFISSFLHGVKFTVFDTVLIPAFFYFYINRSKVSLRLPLIIFSILFSFYWAFSTFIRGSEDSEKSPIGQVISYVLPNYVNLAYSLNEKTFQWDGFSILIPDKFPSFLDKFYIISNEGFVLNDAYNMETAYISYFRFAWYFGPLFFLLIVIAFRRYLISICNYNIFNLFLISMIDFCLLFAFFFHAFIKTKYWYFLIVVFIIHLFSKSKRSYIL